MQAQLNEIVKHGLAAGDSGQPERADWTIDQGWGNYTEQEHAVWNTLFERQTRLLPGRACDEFVAGMRALPIGADQIPDFRHLSEVLMKHTGWQVVAVPGLVPDEVFFEHLLRSILCISKIKRCWSQGQAAILAELSPMHLRTMVQTWFWSISSVKA